MTTEELPQQDGNSPLAVAPPRHEPEGEDSGHVGMRQLLEAGVHFGHQARRWNPRMRSYIFTQRNGIHIIDLQQTLVLLTKAQEYVRDTVARGGNVLFVGTKRQAQDTIREQATRCGMFFVNQRWLGGTLTNFTTIQQRIDHLVRLEDRKVRGEFQYLPKREALKLDEQIEKLNRSLGGIKALTAMPAAMFVVDPARERNAVLEGRRVGIPIVAMLDSNCDPDEVDVPIPSNDDAIRAVRLMTAQIADAVLEGLALRGAAEQEALAAGEDEMTAVIGGVSTFTPQDLPARPITPDLFEETPSTPPAPAVADPVATDQESAVADPAAAPSAAEPSGATASLQEPAGETPPEEPAATEEAAEPGDEAQGGP